MNDLDWKAWYQRPCDQCSTKANTFIGRERFCEMHFQERVKRLTAQANPPGMSLEGVLCGHCGKPADENGKRLYYPPYEYLHDKCALADAIESEMGGDKIAVKEIQEEAIADQETLEDQIKQKGEKVKLA